MSVTKLLKDEISLGVTGTYAPYAYRFEGLRKGFFKSNVLARADGIAALFTLPTPHIYKNDLIVGSIRSLLIEADEKELAYAKSVADNFGERPYSQNVDHYAPNYYHTVEVGLPGLLCEISESEHAHEGDAERLEYLSAMKCTLEAFRDMILGYARRAEELCTEDGYDSGRLAKISANCRALAERAPQSFEEALQLVWFCHIAFNMEGRYAMALGRLDKHLGALCENDIARGVLTPERAVLLLENTFMKIYEHRAILGGDDVVNICIGGTSADGGSDVNSLSYFILEAVKNCGIPGPNLSARVPERDRDHFLDECLKVIGTGIGYPSLMNDRINLAALRRYGYDEEDVYNYCMVGCIENFISGKQPPWSDNFFGTPRYFEPLFNRGKGIFNAAPGVDTGELSEISTMEQFMERFETQLHYGVREYYTKFCNDNARYNPKMYTQPFLSCFCDDTIARAKDICDGGSKYPTSHGVALMGVGTVTDSLAAIEKVVFVDREATLEDIRDALIANFEGYDELREKLLRAPKYGNDDDFADKYAVWFVDFLSREFSSLKTPDGGAVYVGMAANTLNIAIGKTIGATPDGRKAGEYLSDAASPTYGRDTRGVTCTLSSVSKPDYSTVGLGSVVNQKFSPSMFSNEKRAKLAALIKVYFDRGGQQVQINATSREVLEDAMEHPENYRDLVVRVSGFSAYYVTLGKDVQKDILQRTQQG